MWLQWQPGMVVILTYFGWFGNLICGCHGNLMWLSWQHELVLWCEVTTTWCYYYGNLVLCACPGNLVWLSWYRGVVVIVTWRGCYSNQVWFSWFLGVVGIVIWYCYHGNPWEFFIATGCICHGNLVCLPKQSNVISMATWSGCNNNLEMILAQWPKNIALIRGTVSA
jgi:hypothetical protein